jgi:hypothetical protein
MVDASAKTDSKLSSVFGTGLQVRGPAIDANQGG